MPLPIQNKPTPVIDETCDRIAKYLRDGINEAYIPDKIRGLQNLQSLHREAVTAGTEVESPYYTNQINALSTTTAKSLAVVGTRSWDAFNVPLHEFPLLKVYRTLDVYQRGTTLRTSPVIASYCLTLPEQEELQGGMAWISKTMAGLLLNSQTRLCTIIQEPLQAEYRTLLGENASPVYAFLRFNFRIRD
jgi:hypothetical protein